MGLYFNVIGDNKPLFCDFLFKKKKDDCYFHRELGGGGGEYSRPLSVTNDKQTDKKYSVIISSHLMLVLLLKRPHSSGKCEDHHQERILENVLRLSRGIL